ncbi:MAG: hypothetical protein J07HQW2_03827, partial [Haloquadratum walsbyi J07HQW2]
MSNPHDNKDRYGHRHRQNGDHGIGESMPGTPGHSRGTYGSDKQVNPTKNNIDKY